MKTNYLLLLLPLAAFLSCEYEPGINQVEVTYDTIPFDLIELETSSDVRIIQSDVFKVSIQGFQSDVDEVNVSVNNDQLTIDEHRDHPDDFLIKIFVPEISHLDCNGSSFVFGESIFQQNRNMDIRHNATGELNFAVETEDLDLELTNSGYAYFEGSVTNLDVEISGHGWLRSFDLISDFADVRIEDGGSAEVNVVKDLDSNIDSSGDVFFKGHPDINAQITGSGEVIDAN